MTLFELKSFCSCAVHMSESIWNLCLLPNASIVLCEIFYKNFWCIWQCYHSACIKRICYTMRTREKGREKKWKKIWKSQVKSSSVKMKKKTFFQTISYVWMGKRKRKARKILLFLNCFWHITIAIIDALG